MIFKVVRRLSDGMVISRWEKGALPDDYYEESFERFGPFEIVEIEDFEQERAEAREYLEATRLDFIRELETGVKMSEEMKLRRADAYVTLYGEAPKGWFRRLFS